MSTIWQSPAPSNLDRTIIDSLLVIVLGSLGSLTLCIPRFLQEAAMNRDRALKVALVLVGLFFTAAIYPITTMLWAHDRSSGGTVMMLSLYFTLGILLLFAVHNPAANRSLIAFAAWSSFAHATVMSTLALEGPVEREGLIASGVFIVIGVVLLALLPAKTSARAPAGLEPATPLRGSGSF
jgi:hypothetical protein